MIADDFLRIAHRIVRDHGFRPAVARRSDQPSAARTQTGISHQAFTPATCTSSAVAARAASGGRRGWVHDWYAFTLSFKGVLLEGLEVVFIAITFGASQNNVGLAALSAAAAVVVVAVVGVVVHAPLSRVPENTLKFAVGVMLTSFGIFWGAEGAGVSWPGNDAALLVLVPVVVLVALGYTALLRRTRAVVPAGVKEVAR